MAHCVVVPGAELEATDWCVLSCAKHDRPGLIVVLYSMVLGEIGNWQHFYSMVNFILVFQLVKMD